MKKGFTLIELLVVIGIIGILVGLGSVSYSSAQKKARDSKRLTDLADLQKGVEQTAAQCGYKYGNYIVNDLSGNPVNAWSVWSTWPSSNLWGDIRDCQGNLVLKHPSDPLTGEDYMGYDISSTQYTFCPPVLRTVGGVDYLLEATDTCTLTNKSCCVSNKQ